MYRPSPSTSAKRSGNPGRSFAAALLAPLLVCALPGLAGCGAAAGTSVASTSALAITPGISSLDTNCTGCNATNRRGDAVHQFAALLPSGSAAPVAWSLSGGDRVAGAGSIDAQGRYTPPAFLTADHAEVVVTARLAADPAIATSARLTITPGFLQPLTPENAAVGPGGSVTVTGKLALAGGRSEIRFALAHSAPGAGPVPGSLGPAACEHSDKAFTTCSVTYTAPAAIAASTAVHIVASAGPGFGAVPRTVTGILLNTAGVTSNPVTHQEPFVALMALGSSGGNNADYDAHGNTIEDCCSGTLGALLEDTAGRQYLLGNNHVLARSDHAAIGDSIVQPGLIDNNCTPNGAGPGTVPVATLTSWPPLKSPQTNVDAAIAEVASRTVDPAGSILELGARQPDGTLAPAPPGVSSTAGRGEPPTLQMRVAKSGRTTGLTCGSLSAIDLDVSVDYFSDCAETRPYLTKLFTHQLAVSGDRLSDAGDSGSLVVDTATAEPVGLFFAGGTDAAGVGQGIANPAADVLNELGSAAGDGASFRFVGGDDHAVSCLSFGNSTTRAAQQTALNDAEIVRAQQALFAARSLVNPASGVLGVGLGKSSDRAGEAAVLVYVSENSKDAVPATVDGIRTVVIPATAEQVALGAAPLVNDASDAGTLSGPALAHAIRVKEQQARALMRKNVSFFGVGVGQSLDNPREPALVIFVDRNRRPASLPQSIDGVRTRYILMDRLHVTRSYAAGPTSTRHCIQGAPEDSSGLEDPSDRWINPRPLRLP